ncbi:acyltransferase family-domain-containing protein [Ilyonectria sp. MPI-CAGE-AT-0026]|nr:acyltransferase family-domain-containing protein [Ilyonectria sp. MPI-CAGE-AT-0026]
MNSYALGSVPNSLEENTGLLEERLSSDNDAEPRNVVFELDRRFSRPTWTNYLISLVEAVRAIHWGSAISDIAWFCVPSFLQGRHMREKIRPAKVHPTAYLDGMRGVAALFVYFCHYTVQGFVINRGWGWQGTLYGFWRLPFVRLWYCGPPAVSIFFVISGYALSYKPLKLMRSHKTQDFSINMSSMVFRRGIRLFLPTAISTFIFFCMIRLGAFELTRELVSNKAYFRHVVLHVPNRPDSVIAHFMQWVRHIIRGFKLFDFIDRSALTEFDLFLWTIPIEYRCSIYLSAMLVGTARLQTKYRLITLAFAIYVVYRSVRWDFLMFLCGMGLAEWDQIRGAHTTSPTLPVDEKHAGSARQRLKPIFWNLISILALYFLSQPDVGGEETPGWIFLTSIIPEWWDKPYRYWQGLGSVLFILSVSYSAFWLRVFNSGPIQYLGKISYSFYIVHGPTTRLIGYHIEGLAWSITGVEGHWYTVGFALGACFSLPCVVFIADIFWRAVDIPAVKFARWLEGKVNVKED